jgi:hypothetical protein
MEAMTKRFGINASNYRHGLYCIKHFCIDCGKIVCAVAKRCRKCHNIHQIGQSRNKGKNNPMYNIHQLGKDAPNWQGGLNEIGYYLFTPKLKEEIRDRDNYECQLCHKSQKEELKDFNRTLSVHHIDYNRQNCDKENLISLCHKCNMKVNFNRDYWFAYFTELILQK